MKTIVSLPVHECRRVIEDQLRNLSYFFEDVTIILHLSQSYKENTDFSMFHNVHVNPNRYPSRWGNVAYLHYANIKYALDEKIPFEYAVFCSSNELYIRKGVESYLQSSPVFMDPHGILTREGRFLYAPKRNVFYMRTALTDGCFADETLWHFVTTHQLPGICKSQIEGSAYHHTIVEKMWAILEKEFGLEYMMSAKYCAEEMLLPTVFLALNQKLASEGHSIIPKHQFSFVDWYHDFTVGMWIRAVRYWNGKHNRRLERYLQSIDAQHNIYAIKGVKRTYFNKIRNVVRKLIPTPALSKSDVREYAIADFHYNLALLKKELVPGKFVLTAANETLGVLSRIIGKPKSHLKWYVRDRALAVAKKRGWKIG